MDRRVTFKRNLSFACGFSQLSIYVEDVGGNEHIGDVSCRRLCTLKNGQERTVDVSCDDVRIFVVLNRNNKMICIGEMILDAGSENLKIRGICKFSLSKEPVFVFSGRESESVKYSKISGPVKILIVGVVLVLCLAAIHLYQPIMNYFYSISKVPMTYETEKMSITLTKAFAEIGPDEYFYNTYYALSGCWVLILQNDFEKYPDLIWYNDEQYCDFIQKANGDSEVAVSHTDELTYFVVEDNIKGRDTTYYMFAYKTDEAFWLIQFGGYTDEVDYWIDSFMDFAKSVEFK